MKYEIVLEKRASKFLKKQPQNQRIRILTAIKDLPYSGDIKAMKGFSELFRLRVGSYRILYTIEKEVLVIRVIDIGNRGDIYK